MVWAGHLKIMEVSDAGAGWGGPQFSGSESCLHPDDLGSFHKSTVQGTCPCREAGSAGVHGVGLRLLGKVQEGDSDIHPR